MAKIIIHPKALVFDRSGEIQKRKGIVQMEKIPEGYEIFSNIVHQSNFDEFENGERYMMQALDLMKEMAEALEQCHRIILEENGFEENLSKRVLKKFKEWK